MVSREFLYGTWRLTPSALEGRPLCEVFLEQNQKVQQHATTTTDSEASKVIKKLKIIFLSQMVSWLNDWGTEGNSNNSAVHISAIKTVMNR